MRLKVGSRTSLPLPVGSCFSFRSAASGSSAVSPHPTAPTAAGMLRSIAGHLQAAPCADEIVAEPPALDLATGTPLSVSDLMMGCAFVHSKRGEQAADDAQGKATVAAAIAVGIRDFDTA
jgi:hypothetical protein